MCTGGEDEYDTAGGPLGEPRQFVRCKNVVLEVLLDPEDLIEEGALSEFPGFYVRDRPGIAATAADRHPRARPDPADHPAGMHANIVGWVPLPSARR